MRRPLPAALALLAILASLAGPARAQEPNQNQIRDPALFSGLKYRMVGPYRGGRSSAVTGVEHEPALFYMGTTGGGMWKTKDYGQNWTNISDGFFDVASIGAVDVADSDPNVIYVGTGSLDIRGNTSTGRGVYKSTDAGTTWSFVGLRETGQIGRVEIHPRNSDLVYIAALGHPFGKNPERGIFRTRDGGETWDHVLALNDSTGASDLSMNPRNPRILYAGIWRGERKPWTLISGAPEGGVYKTTDGGDTWTKLSGGLPDGIVGKVGVSVSPANPDRVWAIIEAEPAGGVYRSDDAGATWTRVNSENKLRQRAWYYTHVQADPNDENTVWGLNVNLFRSVDGGKTFDPVDVPHGDIHDLWINPTDSDIMVVGDDGGAQVSVTGGDSWSTYYNQPTAELYDVAVDNGFPYRVYGAQQDNTGISIPAWTSAHTLYPKATWEYPAACETGPIAFHPDHPDIIYGGCYGGAINRMDMRTDQRRNVIAYPQLQLGQAGRDLRERFQWVSPIVVSPHDRNVVYHASQRIHRSTDGGMTWEAISPDLTTDTPEHQDYAGGPINHDVTGVEIFNTVFALAVSPHDPQVLWAGSDDGRVHVTRDGGTTWNDVTPSNMPALGTVDEIDLSAHVPGRAIMAVHRYRLDDFRPYVFGTDDYGRTWRLLTNGANGIPADHPVRTVREDPDRRGLLYAGTEFGIFVSFDDGAHWQSLQRNLPVTPITGMQVRHRDLIVSTQGRSFWILDDITPLHELLDSPPGVGAAHLYTPRDAYRVNMTGVQEEFSPEPHPGGAIVYYYLPHAADSGRLSIDIVDAAGRTVRVFTPDSAASARAGQTGLPADSGMHRVVWDLTYRGPELAEGAVIWGYTGGVKAPPGQYQARLVDGEMTLARAFRVLPDPRLTDVAQADYEEQFRVAMQVRDSLSQVHGAIDDIRSAKEQMESAVARAREVGRADDVSTAADSIAEKLTAVEELLNQTKSESGQDPIRFPGMLDNQLVEVYNYVTGPDGYISGGPEGSPTPAAVERLIDLNQQWSELRGRLQVIFNQDLARFNQLIESLGIPAVTIDRGPIARRMAPGSIATPGT